MQLHRCVTKNRKKKEQARPTGCERASTTRTRDGENGRRKPQEGQQRDAHANFASNSLLTCPFRCRRARKPCRRGRRNKTYDAQNAVTTCNRAMKAMDMLREDKSRFDIVLSDVYMPDMDGFRLLEMVGLELDVPVISTCPLRKTKRKDGSFLRNKLRRTEKLVESIQADTMPRANRSDVC